MADQAELDKTSFCAETCGQIRAGVRTERSIVGLLPDALLLGKDENRYKFKLFSSGLTPVLS